MIYPMLMSQQDGDGEQSGAFSVVELGFRIKAHLEPGNHAEPVFTLMLPSES